MKAVGIGLNKTGTKTLGYYFRKWGMRHRTFELEAFQLYREGRIGELLDSMEEADSFEDWPWPLIWREIDARFPDARFVLTVRRSPETWYRSLCNMAVRMGPLRDYEQHIYGYAMPQGHREEHLEIYNSHNRAVEEHFRGRPDKLVRICWEEPGANEKLAAFFGKDPGEAPPVHENKSSRSVYSGDNLFLAQACRIAYQRYWAVKQAVRRVVSPPDSDEPVKP